MKPILDMEVKVWRDYIQKYLKISPYYLSLFSTKETIKTTSRIANIITLILPDVSIQFDTNDGSKNDKDSNQDGMEEDEEKAALMDNINTKGRNIQQQNGVIDIIDEERSEFDDDNGDIDNQNRLDNLSDFSNDTRITFNNDNVDNTNIDTQPSSQYSTISEHHTRLNEELVDKARPFIKRRLW